MRTAREITQQQIADYLEVERATISNYERSASYPSTESLLKLAQYFNVSTDYLLGLSDDPRIELDHLTDEQASVIIELVRQYQILNNQVKNLLSKENS